MLFSGKTAIVTGAGSGIGQAVAEMLAKEGARVALADLFEEKAENTRRIIFQNGGNADVYALDVTSKESVDRAVAKIAEDYGTIDFLVNCAGYSRILPFLEHTEEIWDKTMDINVKGPFLMCQAVVPHMKKQSHGNILNFSSQSGKKATTHYQAYVASKFAVRGFTQSLALELAPDNIRVNCVCPGVVYTPMWEAQIADYARKRRITVEEVMPRFARNIPLGRIGQLEDVTKLVKFLLSDESAYMTGQSLNITGGACVD
ncbi:MAG: SDR family oxidoreductase [Erysipelotrichales bacterium]|nr:SDR family oxidoreductase [Erysipelotrichales bacterium]